jgi:hypothetical protein
MFLCFFFVNRIIVPRGLGQHPLGSGPYDLYADAYGLYGLRLSGLFLRGVLFTDCTNLTNHYLNNRPQLSHVDLDPLE